MSFDNAVIANDGMSVRVDFIGGKEFDPNDPCSVAYEATAEVGGDVLEIGIFAQQHPMRLPPDLACEAMGYNRTLTIRLDEPFTGSEVRDLAGQVLLLEPPAGLAEIGGLPEGWELRREQNVLGSTTRRWERIWSPDPDPWPAQGDSMITLYQSFGGPVDTTGAELRASPTVNGTPATYYVHPPTGEMVLVWPLGDGEVALVGNLQDFTEAAFLEVAESVTIPSD